MIFLILQLFCSSSAFGDVYRFPERDIHLSTAVEYQEYVLDLDNSVSGRELSYMPNVAGYYVPRISYKDIIGLSWAFNIPVGENEKRLLGETKFNDIRFNFNFKNFRFTAYYLQYQGMYIDSSNEVDPNFGGGLPQIQLADLYTRNMGADLTWVWDSSSFSMAGLTAQSERQEKSGGSFLFGVAISEGKFENSGEIIPNNVQQDFDDLGDLTQGRFQTIATKFGYGYNLSFFQKWFLGGAFQLGPGMTRKKLNLSSGSEINGWDPSLRSEILLALGYNGDVFFSSLFVEAKGDYFFLNNTDTNIGTQLLSGGLNVGVHLESIGL